MCHFNKCIAPQVSLYSILVSWNFADAFHVMKIFKKFKYCAILSAENSQIDLTFAMKIEMLRLHCRQDHQHIIIN